MSPAPMQQPIQFHHGAPAAFDANKARGSATQPVAEPGPKPSDTGFAAMLDGFRSSGGTSSGADLGLLLARHDHGDFISFARLLVAGELFAFEWRHTLWIPMFQFDQRDLSTKHDVQRVRAALPASFSGWSLAGWFARPNALLGARRPADVMATDIAAVLLAARAVDGPERPC